MRDEAYIHPLCVHGEAQARWGHDLLRGPLFSQVDHLFCLEPRQYDSSMNTWHKEKEGKNTQQKIQNGLLRPIWKFSG